MTTIRSHSSPGLAALALLFALAPACGGGHAEPSAARPKAAPMSPAARVLEDYIHATGGREAYEKLTSRVVTGTFALPAMNLEGSLVAYQKSPNLISSVVEIPNMGSQETGSDGEVAWERTAMTGARILTGKERDAVLRDSVFNAELKWRELYAKAELVGQETVEGRPAHKIVMTTPEGTTETRFFDVETHLLVRTEAVRATQMGDIPMVTEIGDYKEFDGIKLATRSVTKAMGMVQVVTIATVDHHAEIPPAKLELPAEIKALRDKTPAP